MIRSPSHGIDHPPGREASADASRAPVVVLAAGGGLPLELADALAASRRGYHLVALDGVADPRVERHPHTWVRLGRLGALLKALHATGARELVILGALARPDLSRVGFDFGALRHAPAILALTHGGDDSMLRVVVRFFEGQGFIVRGAGDIAPALLAPEGRVAGPALSAAHAAAIARGRQALRDLSRFDMGQAVVAAPDGIVAFEAAEGTSRMLARLADRGGAGADAVLVKLAKDGQELRVDTPTIGATTIAEASRAGLSGLAVGAGTTLVAERARLVTDAEAAGLFVVGIPHAPAPTVAGVAVADMDPGDTVMARALCHAAARHATRATTDVAAIVRRGHVLSLTRDGLSDGTLATVLSMLPRGWGRWLMPRRTGALAIRTTERAAAALALRAAAPVLARSRLAHLTIIDADPANPTSATTFFAPLAGDMRAIGLGVTMTADGQEEGARDD